MKQYPTADIVTKWMDTLRPRMGDYDDSAKCKQHIMQTLPFQNYEISANLANEIVNQLLSERFPKEYEKVNLPTVPPVTRQQVRLKNMGFKV
jgi:broad specificity polyphosphatase/5'/3'-nucleotidase SurE